jgi:tRNA G18 (ribose-2'-O)-methylase SpoU
MNACAPIAGIFSGCDRQGVEEKGRISEIITLAKEKRLSVERVERLALEELAENPQGVALEASQYPYADLDAIFALAKRRRAAVHLMLDQVQDRKIWARSSAARKCSACTG